MLGPLLWWIRLGIALGPGKGLARGNIPPWVYQIDDCSTRPRKHGAEAEAIGLSLGNKPRAATRRVVRTT